MPTPKKNQQQVANSLTRETRSQDQKAAEAQKAARPSKAPKKAEGSTEASTAPKKMQAAPKSMTTNTTSNNSTPKTNQTTATKPPGKIFNEPKQAAQKKLTFKVPKSNPNESGKDLDNEEELAEAEDQPQLRLEPEPEAGEAVAAGAIQGASAQEEDRLKVTFKDVPRYHPIFTNNSVKCPCKKCMWSGHAGVCICVKCIAKSQGVCFNISVDVPERARMFQGIQGPVLAHHQARVQAKKAYDGAQAQMRQLVEVQPQKPQLLPRFFPTRTRGGFVPTRSFPPDRVYASTAQVASNGSFSPGTINLRAIQSPSTSFRDAINIADHGFPYERTRLHQKTHQLLAATAGISEDYRPSDSGSDSESDSDENLRNAEHAQSADAHHIPQEHFNIARGHPVQNSGYVPVQCAPVGRGFVDDNPLEPDFTGDWGPGFDKNGNLLKASAAAESNGDLLINLATILAFGLSSKFLKSISACDLAALLTPSSHTEEASESSEVTHPKATTGSAIPRAVAMAETGAPTANGNGNGTASNGESVDRAKEVPAYEKLQRETRELVAKSRTELKSLAQIEKKIKEVEANYLESTPTGNILTGFDNYTKGATGAAAQRRKTGTADQNRFFSRSSISYNPEMQQEVLTPASGTSTPGAPTPSSSSFPNKDKEGAANAPTPGSASEKKGTASKKRKEKAPATEDSENDARDAKKVRTNLGAARPSK